jgi:hypothetical protein
MSYLNVLRSLLGSGADIWSTEREAIRRAIRVMEAANLFAERCDWDDALADEALTELRAAVKATLSRVVDEYDSVCAYAGMLIAELEQAKALIAELAAAKQENSLLRSMIDEDSLIGQHALEYMAWLETCEGPEPQTPLKKANARIAALEAENAALRKRAEEAECNRDEWRRKAIRTAAELLVREGRPGET